MLNLHRKIEITFFVLYDQSRTPTSMANTIVLSAEQQQISFRAHNIAKNEPNTLEQSRRAVDSQDDEVKVNVTIPDMFALFLSGSPRVNPNYARVKAESEVWFAKYIHPCHYKPKVYILIRTFLLYRKCQLDARWRRILGKTDFSYFCAITAADAGPQELRTLCDWGNWV